MELTLNIGQTNNLGHTIQDLATSTEAACSSFSGCAFTGAYSAAPGLNQLAANHAGVLHTGIGSAQQVLESYKQQVNWLRQSLAASTDAITGQDDCMAQALHSDRCTVPASSVDAAVFPVRPDTRYENFHFTPPVVAGGGLLAPTLALFETTNTAMVDGAAQQWTQAAAEIEGIASSLDGVAAEIVAVNKGEVFDAAAGRITDTAQAGHNFAANARTMAASVSSLNAIQAWAVGQLRTAQAELSLIPDPLARKAAEAQYMLGFVNVALPAAVQQGVPPISNLMDKPPAPPAEQTQGEVGMTQTATAGLPLDGANMAGFLSSAGKAIGAANTLVGNLGGGLAGIGPAGPGSFQAIMQAGQQVGAGGLPTAAAGGLGAVSMLNAGENLAGQGGRSGFGGAAVPWATPMAGQGAAAGRGAGGSGSLGARGSATPQNMKTAPTQASISGGQFGMMPGGAAAGGGVGRRGGAGVNQGYRLGAPGHGGANLGGGASIGGYAGHGGDGMPGASGAPGVSGAVGARGIGHGLGFGGGGGVGGGAAGAGQGASVGATRGATPMMGGVPMGAGAGGNNAAKQAKAVTSAVEAEGNIADLLGQPRRAVPGVIGDWVRD